MRKVILAAVLGQMCIAGPALAAVDNACWNRGVQRMDFFMAPPTGGDSQFFTSTAPTGVVALAFATTQSMMGFPLKLYEARTNPVDPTPTGCTNIMLNSLRYYMNSAEAPTLQGAYNVTFNYPDPEPAYTKVATASDGIDTTQYYQYGQWPNGPPGSIGYSTTPQTALAACNGATASNAVLSAQCQTCVTTRGFWLNPTVANNATTATAGVFAGKWLRFYPPKWIILKLAYKRLINGPLLSKIREGVINAPSAVNPGVGGYVAQKLLPNSCQGQGAATGTGILMQKLQVFDLVPYSNPQNPLAEMLFNIGYYLSGDDPGWMGTSGYFTSSSTVWSNAGDDGKGGPCANNPCGQEFVVLFSDGRGDYGNPACTAAGVGPCQAANACSTLGMKNGTNGEMDGDNFLDPSIVGGAGPLITNAGVRSTPPGTCDMDFLDDVAGWMFNNPMVKSFPGRSNVKTYAIGIGDGKYGELEILKQAAARGGGIFVNATNFGELEAAIQTVLTNINDRTTSFSVAAITTVQTRGSTFAFIPRFKPIPGVQWEGKLFRFKLFNEFSAGCTPSDYSKSNDWLNPNRNSSCNDVFLTDADGVNPTQSPTTPSSTFFNSFIGEDSLGNFVKLDTSQPYPWPLTNPPVAANPVWDAEAVLRTRVNNILAGNASTPKRNIWTVYDPGNTGKYTTRLQIDTTDANMAIITPLLKLDGLPGTFCTELPGFTKRTYATEQDCAKELIRFLLGEDPLMQNPANQTNPPPTVLQARPNILGDIFHSSPILVTPPVPQFLCDLGVATQCLSSLYSGTLTPNGASAYVAYAQAQAYRQQILLVGANDGMLHAFSAGTDRTGDDPETNTVESSSNHYFDLGTGDELWAFVPPDMLPKLQKYMLGLRHEILVDGTPMVRDIWVDGSGSTSADHKKQSDEFHTVVIFGERAGGRSWTALDLTDTTNPNFLWSWPPPGTTDDWGAGQSWNDHAPSPPPIGPVAVDDPQGPFTVGSSTAKASERYIVALGGGYDPYLIRGRGIFMVDAWTGQQVFRFSSLDQTSTSDIRNAIWPVASTVGLLDINNDGIFDTAVVGDVGGQVWTVNMQVPGKDTGNNGYYTNWFAARAFKMASGLALYNMTPFFQMPAATILPTGEVRVYLGSGDRQNTKDSPFTSCAINNLEGCIRRGCTVSMAQSTYSSGTHYDTGTWAWSSTTATGVTWSPAQADDGNTTAQSNACTDAINGAQTFTLTCGSKGQTLKSTVMCDWGASKGAATPCPDQTGTPLLTEFMDNIISCSSPYVGSKQPCWTPTVTPQNPRFYSIKLYDASGNRSMTATQTQYDGAALTDTNLVNADTTAAASSGNGWYVNYQSQWEKTSSGGLLFGGCMIWNSLTPNTSQNTNVCSGSFPPDTANLYQADPTTGAVACGASTQNTRYVTRSVIVPPPMPTPVVAVNPKTQQITYSGISLEPGNPPLQVQVGGGEMMGMAHWLEVARPTHDCRHNGVNCR
jgi:type IV pilus assembly protein PilY1